VAGARGVSRAAAFFFAGFEALSRRSAFPDAREAAQWRNAAIGPAWEGRSHSGGVARAGGEEISSSAGRAGAPGGGRGGSELLGEHQRLGAGAAESWRPAAGYRRFSNRAGTGLPQQQQEILHHVQPDG